MRKAAKYCTYLGLLFIAMAFALFVFNRVEDRNAQASTDHVMTEMVEMISETVEETPLPDPYAVEMSEKEIDGIKYIGYVSIPELNLNLPIISEWSDAYLKLSPCRYYGSSTTDDLVLMAHNYKSHFGLIGDLRAGHEIVLTNMDGEMIRYEVVDVEVLSPETLEEMKDGGYDLTLFTCTYDGVNRITVRCDRL